MSDRENYVKRLNEEIDSVLQESGVFDLIERFEKLKEAQEEFNSVKTEGKETVRQVLTELHDEDEVIGNVRIRDGNAYKNKSPSLAGKEELMDAVRNSEHFDKEDVEAVDNALNMSNDQLRKSIENKERVLMDDERDFDAVTLKLKNKRRYLKLVRLDGNKSHKMQPLEDIEDKHVEELIKFIRYREEKIELIGEMTGRVQEAIEKREEYLTRVEEVAE